MTDAQWQLVHDAICAAQDGGADEAYAAWLAVLDAIAEPSEAMICIGNEAIVKVLNAQSLLKALDEGTPALKCYRAMIAELRKEAK